MLSVYTKAFFTTYILEEKDAIKSGPKYWDVDFKTTRWLECVAQILHLTNAFPAYCVQPSSTGKCFADFFWHQSPLHVQFHELQRLRGVDFVIQAGRYACHSILVLIFAIPLALIATAVKIALFIFDQDRRNRYWIVVNYLKPKPETDSNFSGAVERPLALFSGIPEEILAKICQNLDFVANIRLSCTSKSHHVYFTTIFASQLREQWGLPPKAGSLDITLVKQNYRFIRGECPLQVLEFLKLKNLLHMSFISEAAYFEIQMGESPMACTRKFDFFAFRCERIDTKELGFVTFELKHMLQNKIEWVMWHSGLPGTAVISPRGLSLNKDVLKSFLTGQIMTFPLHPMMINQIANPAPAIPLKIIHSLLL